MRAALASFAAAAGLVVATGGLAQPAAERADTYPSKPVRLIVPWPPGGGADGVARLVQPKLSERLGQPVVIDNRAGAGGNIGAGIAAQAAPDGYTVLLASASTHAINPGLYSTMPFREADFDPVTLLATVSNVLVVNPSLPVSTVRELIEASHRSNIGYASSGNGSIQHLAAELFKSMTGARLTHIPYKGGGPAVAATMGGEVQMLFSDPMAALPQIKAGRLRALATTGDRRLSGLPDVPTLAQAGVSGYNANSWIGVLVPAGTPAAIVERLNRDIVAVLQIPEVQERMATQGYEPAGTPAADFGRFLNAEIARWGKVIKAAGARVD